MSKVTKVLLVTPLWDFPAEGGKDYRIDLAIALDAVGITTTLAGPVLPGAGLPAELPVRVIAYAADRRRPNHSPHLARASRPLLSRAVQQTQAELVHYLDLRLAGLGTAGQVPATGWLGDTHGSLAPLLPRPRSGQGWFWRWRDGRTCRAMQIGALARLAGLAVPTEEVGRAAAKVQGRGTPTTHIVVPLEHNPATHAAGLIKLWNDLPI